MAATCKADLKFFAPVGLASIVTWRYFGIFVPNVKTEKTHQNYASYSATVALFAKDWNRGRGWSPIKLYTKVLARRRLWGVWNFFYFLWVQVMRQHSTREFGKCFRVVYNRTQCMLNVEFLNQLCPTRGPVLCDLVRFSSLYIDDTNDNLFLFW